MLAWGLLASPDTLDMIPRPIWNEVGGGKLSFVMRLEYPRQVWAHVVEIMSLVGAFDMLHLEEHRRLVCVA